MKKVKELEEIEVIRVNNVADVIKAADLLETIGIYVFSSDKKKTNFANIGSVRDHNFLIKETFGYDWGIHSHYIEEGISIDELDEKIEEILEIYPNIKESMEGVEIMTEELGKIRVSLSEIEVPQLRFDGKYFEEYNRGDIEYIIDTISEIKKKVEELRLILL